MKRSCENCDKEFEITEGDQAFYGKIKVPPPTRCPRCRTKRRMSFWNERRLFRKDDALTRAEIFSMYPSESPVRIYERSYWLGDAWDPMSYGREYDFSKSFFEQFRDLYLGVPLPAVSNDELVNSDYCNNVNNLKDCYLCFNGNYSEGCSYLVGFSNCRDSFDLYQSANCELCYDVFSADKCFECFFSTEVGECHNVLFSRDCEGCQDCFGCANLKNKKYHIFNKPYSKEDYEKYIKGINLGSYKKFLEIKNKVKEFWNSQPHRYMHGTNNDNVVGEYVYNSRNVEFSYQGLNMENVKYLQCMGPDIKDSYDYTNWGGGAELVYETVSAGSGLYMIRFCFNCYYVVSDLDYCATINNSSHLFGCVGLRNKMYCILNKQYSESEYFALRTKIIEQMNSMPYVDPRGKTYKYGEFLPPEFSPYTYKQTSAMDFYPLADADIKSEGYKEGWVGVNNIPSTTRALDLEDDISKTTDSLLREVIECLSCKGPYRIIEKEFAFLKKYGIPTPRNCPDCRYGERVENRNPLTWWQRNCMNTGCANTFKTSFPPVSKAIVYCETCYEGIVG